MMAATRIIGLLGFIVIVGFLAFGVRQGLREKRRQQADGGPSIGSDSDRDGDGAALP